MPSYQIDTLDGKSYQIDMPEQNSGLGMPFSKGNLKQSLFQGTGNVAGSMVKEAFSPGTQYNPAVPFMMQNPVNAVPTNALEPAGAIAGGISGTEVPGVPFAATALSAVGSSLGQLLANQRRRMAGDPVVPFDIGRPAVAAGATLVGAGPARAIPFLASNRSVTDFTSKMRPLIEGIRRGAVQVFGKALKGLDEGATVDGSNILKGLFSQVETEGGTRSVASAVKLQKVGERGFVQDLAERAMRGNTGMTSSEVQNLANILDRKPSTQYLADEARNTLLEAHPDVVPGMRAEYARRIGDYQSLVRELQPGLERQVGFSSRLAQATGDPDFQKILIDNGLGDLIPQLKDLARAETIKGIPARMGRVLERVIPFRLARTR